MNNADTALRVLVAGESWMTHSIHVKGFDSFTNSSYHEGGDALLAALRGNGMNVIYQPSHIAANAFPDSVDLLRSFDVVVLSDIGANTLLLPDRSYVRSERSGNRLHALADWVRSGGGLLMVGGYMTFQGIEGKAAYHGTAVDAVLPVALSTTDDRQKHPEGVVPETVDPEHPVAVGLTGWPALLGWNRAQPRPDASVLARIGGDPLIAVRSVENGRSAVFASDCGPHWGPPSFLAWDGYAPLWGNLARWLAGRIG
jgi:uncharacterized membrane protein